MWNAAKTHYSFEDEPRAARPSRLLLLPALMPLGFALGQLVQYLA